MSEAKIILVCGLPSTGKSTVAKAIAKKMKDAVVLRTDEIRKKLIQKPKYTEDEKKFVYGIIFMLTESLLKNGVTCIIDGTFYKKSFIKELKNIASENRAKLSIIECVLDEKILEKRIKKRKKGLSDADFEVYKKIKKQWEPIKEKHIVFDTGVSWKELHKNIDEIMRKI
jgi:predicted kinase